MSMTIRQKSRAARWTAAIGAAAIACSLAVLPVTTDAQEVVEAAPDAILDSAQLDTLVAPIALYPDDLLAIVLPASTYPLQVVEAQRFLVDNQGNANAEPDPAWDDAIVAMLNYPEALELLNDDLDWTWSLGQAVLSQQGDVIEAVERFRDDAYLAGNLASDEYQTVTREAERVVIEPADPEVIYVPYYDPVQVVVRQPRPVFFYHPRAYPLYYYPYAVGHRFYRDPFFWGVSTAFSISWRNRYLHLSYFDTIHHPFYGYRFNNRRFFRHRHSRDYFVRGGTGRFDRRGNHYRWYPNRFHGVRPNYRRHSRAGRQLTYRNDGYTRNRTVERQARNRYTGDRNRLGRNDTRRRDIDRSTPRNRFSRGSNNRNGATANSQRNRAAANTAQRNRFSSDARRRDTTANRNSGRTTARTESDRRIQNRARSGQTANRTRGSSSRFTTQSRSRANTTTARRNDARVRDNRAAIQRDRTVTRSQTQRSRAAAPQQRRATPQRQVQSRQVAPQRQSRQSSRRSEARASNRSSQRQATRSSRSSSRAPAPRSRSSASSRRSSDSRSRRSRN